MNRRTSSMWDETWDPFQVFKVDHEYCWDFEIVVHNGENITKGNYWRDLLDTPDPFVVLRIPGSSNSSHRTSSLDNTVSPIWNQTFHFYLEPHEKHVLHVILKDENLIYAETLGEDTFTLNDLEVDVPLDHTFIFQGGSKIFTTLTLQKNKRTDLRFSLALCEKEKECLRKRRHNVMIAMQKLLGAKGPTSKDQVPVVAVLGSGGGFRAMICFSGAVKALLNSGILDCSIYISGLSGSSWFISTMYSNDKFPDVTFDEIFQELKESVTNDWKRNLLKFPFYCSDMIAKHRKGQPVSFTDFFGHLLGDVLLKGRKTKKLSDQQEIVLTGRVPFPLFTCLHAKAAVTCKTFSEWVEFSPFEIGITKYGTFMKTEDFGSKFLCGKKIKAFPEFPLHFLQGVWGSAFTVLMKQIVLQGGTKKDPIQMLRDIRDEREFNERVEEEGFDAEKDSDTDEENSDVGSSAPDEKPTNQLLDTIEKMAACTSLYDNKSTPSKITDETIQGQRSRNRAFSFNVGQTWRGDEGSCGNTFTQSDIGTESDLTTNQDKNRRLKRQDAIRTPNTLSTGTLKKESSISSDRRQCVPDEPEAASSFIHSILRNTEFFKSRAGRAGEILNPFRGLSLRKSFPLSPFFILPEEEEEEEEEPNLKIGKGCRYDALDNTAKKLFIVDSGLAFNSPYPLLLRPQRAVDIYLSFDFSQRPNDSFPPFNELLLAEKWAAQNKVPFPPIESKIIEYKKDPEVKEVYVFKHPTKANCPVILHFPIVNNKFRKYTKPGVERTTKEEFDFADFSLFDDPTQPFSTYNFWYEDLHYERLIRLVEFNTLSCLDVIKDVFSEVVEKKSELTKRSLANTAMKVKKLLKIARDLKESPHLRLRVNQEEGRKFINFLRQSSFYRLSREFSESFLEPDDVFYDAEDKLYDLEEADGEEF